MIEERLLELVLAVLTVLVVLLLLAWSAHGLWKTWRRRVTEPAVERARTRLLHDLAEGLIDPETEAAVRSLSSGRQVLLLARVGRQIAGRQRSLLAQLARATGAYQRAEADCRSVSWSRRLRGAEALTLLGGGESAVTPLLRDRSVYVRAQAAEWAVEHPIPPVLEALLDLLDDPDPAARFAGADAVVRMGQDVAEAIAERLTRAAHSDSAHDGTARLLDVAAGIRDTSFIPPALRLSRVSDPRIRARAITLLGLVGGEDAVARAQELLNDETAEVRRAAVGALGNLGHWPAAPDVGGRLRDQSWEVRRKAGLALRAMGPPGELVLRRATKDDDRFAADMARLTLALPYSGGPSP